jgi:putative flippase GtrA
LNKFTVKKFWAYTAFILIGFTLDFIIYSMLVYFKNSIFIANFFGFICGTTANLIMIRKFVYVNPKYSFFKDIQYTISFNGILFLIGMLILWILVHLLGLNAYTSKIISNTITFLFNFIVRTLLF